MSFQFSAFRLHHTPSPLRGTPPVSGGESGRSTDYRLQITDYRLQMTDYRGRYQLVGTRHAVSAKVKYGIVDVSDTACRVPT